MLRGCLDVFAEGRVGGLAARGATARGRLVLGRSLGGRVARRLRRGAGQEARQAGFDFGRTLVLVPAAARTRARRGRSCGSEVSPPEAGVSWLEAAFSSRAWSAWAAPPSDSSRSYGPRRPSRGAPSAHGGFPATVRVTVAVSLILGGVLPLIRLLRGLLGVLLRLSLAVGGLLGGGEAAAWAPDSSSKSMSNLGRSALAGRSPGRSAEAEARAGRGNSARRAGDSSPPAPGRWTRTRRGRVADTAHRRSGRCRAP